MRKTPRRRAVEILKIGRRGVEVVMKVGIAQEVVTEEVLVANHRKVVKEGDEAESVAQ
jgi:hypothetical protein